MKHSILLAFCMMIIASSVYSQCLPVNHYIGLYADPEPPPDLNSCCVSWSEPYYSVEIYIWFLPSQMGMLAVDFAITYPSNLIQSTITYNPDISVWMGDPESGISAIFLDCQMDWAWIFHQTLYITDLTPAWIEIIPHPDVPPYEGGIRVASCEPVY